MKDLPDKMTLGEKYGPAMKITEQAEADACLAKLVKRTIRLTNRGHEEAEAMERRNLGYYAGYYDSETAERVERLFKCCHPVFGKTGGVGR